MDAPIDAAPPPPSSISLETLGEVLAYAGAAAALAAAGIVAAQRASGSLTLVLLATIVSMIVMLAVGWFAGGHDEPRRRRLRGVFWLSSLQSATEALVILFLLIAKMHGRGAILSIAILAAAYALVLWILHRGALQQIGLFLTILLLVGALTFPSLGFVAGPPDVTLMGVALLVLGVGWFLLGQTGVVGPRRTAHVLGTLAILVAPFFFAPTTGRTALVLLAIAAAVMVVIAEVVDDAAAAGVAIAGLIVGTSVAVDALVITSSSAALVVLVLGLVCVGAAVALLRAGGRVPPQPAAPPADEAPDPPMPASP